MRNEDQRGKIDSEVPEIEGLEKFRPLQSGGMGSVFRADQISLEREVAVKTIHPRLLLNEKAVTLFRRESRILAGLSNPNIVQVFYTGESNVGPFYVMPLLNGKDLWKFLKGLNSQAIAKTFLELSRALAFVHKKGILHRDIKPANVVVEDDGRPILVDFGISQTTQSKQSREESESSCAGTPAYLAPELLDGGLHSAQSDIYALGVSLYQCLTGSLPFYGDSSQALHDAILGGNPVLPRALDKEIPPSLQAICLKAMDRLLADRYLSMENFARDIERFLKGEHVLARPSLFKSIVEKNAEMHCSSIQKWASEGFIGPTVRDSLLGVYDQILSRGRHWIFNFPILSLPLVFLYLSALLFFSGGLVYLLDAQMSQSPLVSIPILGLPCIGCFVAGKWFWENNHFLRGLPLFLGSVLLFPFFLYVTVDAIPVFSEYISIDPSQESQEVIGLDVQEMPLFHFRSNAEASMRNPFIYYDLKMLLVGIGAMIFISFVIRFTESPSFQWLASVFFLISGLAVEALLGFRWIDISNEARIWALMPIPFALALTGVWLERGPVEKRAFPCYIVSGLSVGVLWGIWSFLVDERTLTSITGG